MSGPKIIDYQAVERQRAEAARRRWLALCGRADALRQRSVEAGHPDCAIKVGQLESSASTHIERRCDELATALEAAAAELSRRQFAERTREAAAGLHDVLADLERREREADAQAASEATSTRERYAPAVSPSPRPDFAEKVTRQMTALRVASTELAEAAQTVLRETDPARARLLYSDLKQRVAAANKAEEVRNQRLTEIAELRAQADSLSDPAPLRTLLDHATALAQAGEDTGAALRQARTAITSQLDAAAAEADREFVRQAIAESLQELGYQVADVDIATPESLILRQSRTHGVRADIQHGRIDIRAVRLGAANDAAVSSADRDAEDEFCRHIPGLRGALHRRGVATEVKEAVLPGLFAPETVTLRSRGTAPTAAHEEEQFTSRRRSAQ